MTNKRFVSYLRVSTARQGASGLGLEAQRSAVAGYLNGDDWTLVREVVEIESGKRNDRPALAEALRLCRRQRGTLVIAKLDRLARNVVFIATLMEEKVSLLIDLLKPSPSGNKEISMNEAASANAALQQLTHRYVADRMSDSWVESARQQWQQWWLTVGQSATLYRPGECVPDTNGAARQVQKS